MFAVGTWDTVNEELVLACDSMGVKLPLRRPRDHRDWAGSRTSHVCLAVRRSGLG